MFQTSSPLRYLLDSLFMKPRSSRTQRKILDYVRAHPGCSAAQAGRAIGIRGGMIWDTVRLLIAKDLIEPRRREIVRLSKRRGLFSTSSC